MNSMIRTAPGYQAPMRFFVVAGAHVVAAFVIAGALKLPAVVEHFEGTLVPVPNVPDRKIDTFIDKPNGGEPLRTVDPADPTPPKFDVESDPDTVLQTTIVGDTFDGTGGSGPVLPVRVGVRADPAHPLTQPEYPLASIRLQEQGIVVLELSVGADGRVLEARVQQSSGSARLDAAAVREALRHWRLLPATEDGQPVAGWFRERVNFRLQDVD